jgi:hypothetical protein
MGWFKRYQESVIVKPGAASSHPTAAPQVHKTPTVQSASKTQQPKRAPNFDDYDKEVKQVLKHAGLFKGWTETPIAVTGVRQHKDELLQLSRQVIDLAPAWVIAEPTEDNPDAMRVEALGIKIGTIPKAKCKRIRKLGDKVPAMVMLDASNYDYYGHNKTAGIRAEVVVKGIQ